jgi:hypothetical protein
MDATSPLGSTAIEIGMAIDEEKAVSSHSAQREQVPDQDAAVAAEHNRHTAGLDEASNLFGQPP